MKLLLLTTVLLASTGNALATCAGSDTDPAAAFAACRQIADAGDADAQRMLGNLYQAGNGVAQSNTDALVWYRKAADQGNAAAMHNIGVMYDSGNGVPRDHVVAAEWYRQAIDRNFAPAMYNLGLLYEYGMSLKQDYAMAMQLYRQAAELGEPLAQFAIALLYDKGLGVEADLVQAYMWFDITGAGHENAIFNRDSVATDMQPDQIARARQLAAEWRADRPQLFPPAGDPPRP